MFTTHLTAVCLSFIDGTNVVHPMSATKFFL